MDWILTGAALLFAIANGANDGSTLVAVSSRVPGVSLLAAVFISMSSVAVIPLLFGHGVATTFLSGLVAFGDGIERAVIIAVVATLVTVLALSYKGLPTSLTIAMLGALAGSGVGQGSEIHWDSLLSVLAVALGAPILGGIAAYVINSSVNKAGIWPGRPGIGHLHLAAFTLQSAAYGANDGQKMLAVLIASISAGPAPEEIPIWAMLGVTVCFGLGTVLGLRRYSRALVGAVASIRPKDAVISEFSSATSVIGAAILGGPVSTTQSVVGSMIGATVHTSRKRVRWERATSIIKAWVTTLPFAFSLGLCLSWLLEVSA